MKTRVVNSRRTAYDVLITRPGRWGDPFVIGAHGDRVACVRLYREWLLTQPHLMALIPTLKGKRLGCACRMKPCHGDVLVDLAEAS